LDILRTSLVALGSAAVLTSALASAGCGGSEAGEPQAAVVDTVHVRVADVPSTIQAIGTIEADHSTSVAAEVDGAVARILRDEGSRVGRGAGVIQLDPGPYRFAVQSAQANLGSAEAQLAVDERLLARYEQLLTAGAVDRQTYEDLQARVETDRAAVGRARAALDTARWNLGKTTISAPFAGAVGHRHVQLGQWVNSGDVVFDLVDADPLRIRFRLPETVVGTVEVGDQVRFRVRSDTVSARLASVDYVSPEIDSDTRTFEVTARYSNPEGGVVPGAYADVTVTTAIHEAAPIVPEAALVTEGESNFVYVVINGPKAQKRPVEEGSRMDGQVEILRGVRAGEVVLVAGQHGLQDGAAIRFAQAPATGGPGAGAAGDGDTTPGTLRRE
jgi:membrane fusion protein (multidrug efflux system)